MSLSEHPDELAAKVQREQRSGARRRVDESAAAEPGSGEAPTVPEAPAETSEASGTSSTPETPDSPEATPGTGHDPQGLARDLAEVGGSRPERAFNVGAVAGIVVTVAAVIFVVQNSQSAQFDWLWFDFEVPMWMALLGAVLVGVVLVLTIIAVHHRRQRRIGRRTEATRRLRSAIGGDRTAPAT
jgi:uncharacterized integral membrane protein